MRIRQGFPRFQRRETYPRSTVEAGTQTFQVDAKVAEEPERTRLYDKMVEMLPGFDDYHRKTERMIPVILLKPVK